MGKEGRGESVVAMGTGTWLSPWGWRLEVSQ